MSDMETDNPSGNDQRADGMDQPLLSPGVQLARRREELGLAVDQVASQLNLAPRQIQAIEADNYAALPGLVSTRGFIRSYAKLMKIDPEPLLQALAPAALTLPDARPTVRSRFEEKPLAENRLSFSKREGRSSKLGIVIGVLVAAAIAVAVAQTKGLTSFLSKSEPGDNQVMEQKQELTVEQEDGRVVEVLPPPAPQPAPQPAPAPQSSAVMPQQPVAAVKPTAAKATDPAPVKVETSVPADAADGKDMLVIQVRETSWIELKRPDGSVLVSREIPTGEVESFKVRGAVQLTVGNAAGVDARLRGELLDLQSNARNNVARLNLK